MLSRTFLNTLENRLNYSIFSDDDFDIRTVIVDEEEDDLCIEIQYKYNPNYKMSIELDPKGNVFSGEFSPGSIVVIESFAPLSEYSFLDKVSSWLRNIQNEIKLTPMARQTFQNKEELNDIQKKLAELITNGDNYFTKDEGEDLKARLDTLETAFKEKLAENIDHETQFNAEVEKLNKEINFLKEQVLTLTKKNWVLAYSAKIFNWGKRNPGAVRRLGGFTRELLPQEIKDAVPQEALDQLLPAPEEQQQQ